MTKQSMILTGLLALATGAMIYIADRPVGIFSFLGDPHDLFYFGNAGYWLPDAIHPFAMAMISAGVADGQAKSLRFWAVFWGSFGLLMEIGQFYRQKAADLLPAMLDHIPLLNKTGDYFIHGTFDPIDILAIFLGSSAAFALSFYKQTGIKMLSFVPEIPWFIKSAPKKMRHS